MIIVIVLKVLILCILSIYASFTDIKLGIIKNEAVLSAIIIGLILDMVGWAAFDSLYIKSQLTNIASIALVSILLYALHIWAGGDCKFMIAIATLAPYELYISIYSSRNSLILILAFTFILSYLYLIIDSINLAIKKKKAISKEKFISNLKTLLGRWICCISYIFLIDQIAMQIFPSILNKLQFLVWIINICVIFIVSGLHFLQNKFCVSTIFILGFVVKIMLKQPIISKFMLINYALVILFIMLRLLLDEYNQEIIETSKVKKGMILSATTTVLFLNSKVKGLPAPSTEDLRSRLTEDEAASVRRWEKSKYGCPTIQIVRKIPFAIFITFGTIIYLALGATAQ